MDDRGEGQMELTKVAVDWFRASGCEILKFSYDDLLSHSLDGLVVVIGVSRATIRYSNGMSGTLPYAEPMKKGKDTMTILPGRFGQRDLVAITLLAGNIFKNRFVWMGFA